MKAKAENNYPKNRHIILDALDVILTNIGKNPKGIHASIKKALGKKISLSESGSIASMAGDMTQLGVNALILRSSLPYLEQESKKLVLGEDSFITLLLRDEKFRSLVDKHRKTITRLVEGATPLISERFLASQTPGLRSSVNVALPQIASDLIAQVAADPANLLLSVGKVVGTFILAGQRIENAKTAAEAVAIDKEFSTKKLTAILSVLGALPPTIFPAIAPLLGAHGDEIVALLTPQIPNVVTAAFKNVRSLANRKKWDPAHCESIVPAPLRLLSGVRPELLKIVLPAVVGLAHAVVSNVSAEQLQKILQAVQDRENVVNIGAEVLQALSNANISDFIAKELAPASGVAQLATDSADIRKVAENISTVLKLDLPPDIITHFVAVLPYIRPVIAKLVGTALAPEAGLPRVYVAATKSPVDIEAVLAALPDFVRTISPVLEHDLPRLLTTKQADIAALVEKVLTLPQVQVRVKAFIGEKSDTLGLVTQASPVALKIVPQILPHATKLVGVALQDKDTLAVVSRLLAPKEKDQKAVQALEAVGTIAKLTGNREVQESLASIASVLASNADDLGKVIDHFLNKTAIGKKYNVQGAELLNVASKYLPQFAEAAKLYGERKYGKMIVAVLQLLAKKEVLSLMLKAVFTKKPKDRTHVERLRGDRRQPPRRTPPAIII